MFIAAGSVLGNSSSANEIMAVNILMITAPAIGGILLLREGWIRTGFFVAGTALIFGYWLWVMLYLHYPLMAFHI